MKILIIEDDSDISELLEYNFKTENWFSRIEATGSTGLQAIPTFAPDLIILDLMLPDMTGLDICRKIKKSPTTAKIPVIMLTAKSEEIDRVVGFEIGADDYVTKPFSPRELILRIKAIKKRTAHPQTAPESKQTTTLVDFGVLHLDAEKYEVKVSGKNIQLTSMEFKLLYYFLTHPGKVATRDKLLNKIWGYEADLTTRTVDTHIKRLREKLKVAGDYIETIRGVGYRFKESP